MIHPIIIIKIILIIINWPNNASSILPQQLMHQKEEKNESKKKIWPNNFSSILPQQMIHPKGKKIMEKKFWPNSISSNLP